MTRARPRRRRRDGSRRSAIGRRDGFALESTMLLLVLFGALIGIAMAAVATYTRAAGTEVKAAQVTYAAEGGGDQVMAQLDAAMSDGVLSAGDVASLTTPTLPGFTFSQQTTTSGAPVTRTITKGSFAGLYALEQPMLVRVTADDPLGNRAAVEVGVSVQAIPIFQFGVFFDRDLEITNGPPLTFTGWVHSNRNIYISSAASYYRNQVTAADSFFWSRKDQVVTLGGVQIANNAGTLVPVDFDSRSHAGAAFVARSNLLFDGKLRTKVSGVRPLKLPLPTGMNPVELIRPASVGDGPAIAAVRMANKADLRLVINLALPLTSICTEATIVRATGRTALGASCASIFQFVRNAFYDGREMRRPDVLEVDMAALRTFVNVAPATRQVSVVYVEFQNADTTVLTRDYPAIRLRNGSELPLPPATGDAGGVTVATNAALYVRGDYNTVNWKPAALMADVATFLSNSWTDAASATFPRTNADLGATVYAGLIAGNSETPCDARSCGVQPYGGGLENFPRFLENWSGDTFRYVGSLVCLFPSSQSQRLWGHTLNGGSGYYGAPVRDWAFETRFLDPNQLPPGTPRLGSVLQVAYRNVY